MKALLARIAAIAFSAAALAANAGGPLSVCANVATKYPGAGAVTLNYDGGGSTLGARSKAAADTLVTNSVSLWTNVPTATVSLARGSDLPVDVTTANYATYIGNSTYNDGLNPVVYDTNGSITDLLLGTGAKSNVLGFAGSAWYDYGSYCQYAEGRAVINGYLGVSDTTMSVVLAHEMGHMIGMDHTQLDSAQSLATGNYPLMYPIAYRGSVSLHEDDAAAVTALYPDSNVNTTYGTLSGTFTTGGGVAIRGANIWARNTTTNQVFSVVSDYLMQGTGYFKLLLTPGTYTLYAEAIDTGFTGGSGVGPYSDDITGLSFQPPNYAGANGTGAALAVTMTSPASITITAGCNATVTFRSSGTGTMGTTCVAAVPVASTMTSPSAGSTLAGSSATFNWTAGSGFTARYLIVGTTSGGQDLFSNRVDSVLSQAVSGIPTDGRTIYVQLSSYINNAWQTSSYTYRAANTAPAPATAKSTITSPAAGGTLAGSTLALAWTAGSGVSTRYLIVGTTLNGQNLFSNYVGTAGQSVTVPTAGQAIYVQLSSYINGAWQTESATYTAANTGTPPPPVTAMSTITTPTTGSTLAGSTLSLGWTAGTGVTARYLIVGSSLNGQDLFSNYVSTTTAQAVTVPTDGRTIYVQLSSYINGAWQTASATYIAATGGSSPPPASGKSLITTPTSGTTLVGPTATFGWTAGSGWTYRYLMVGTTPGGSNLFSNHVGSASSQAVSIACGFPIYARLMSYINNVWEYDDKAYSSVCPLP